MSDRRIFTFEEFTLDLDQAVLKRFGTTVNVEPQVFDLIALLAQSDGRLVTRDEIIDAVWGGRIVSDSAISSRINSARMALGDDGQRQDYIKTVHGRGFRWVASTHPGHSEDNSSHHEPPCVEAEVRYCRTHDGVNLAYTETGEGQTIVKAASFLTHVQYDSEGQLWRHWIEELSSDYRYVRYDQRGNGLSDLDVEDFSFESMITDLEAVVDHLDLQRFTLLGISQGASIAIAYARRHPERVNGLLICGGYAAGWKHSGNEKHRERREAMLELVRSWDDPNPASRQVYASLFLPDGTSEQHAEFMRLQQVTAPAGNAYKILNTFSAIDIREELHEVTVPALIMHCRNDAVVPLSAGREIAANLKNSRFVMLDGANHLPQASDSSWPRFLSEVRRFMTDRDM